MRTIGSDAQPVENLDLRAEAEAEAAVDVVFILDTESTTDESSDELEDVTGGLMPMIIINAEELELIDAATASHLVSELESVGIAGVDSINGPLLETVQRSGDDSNADATENTKDLTTGESNDDTKEDSNGQSNNGDQMQARDESQ